MPAKKRRHSKISGDDGEDRIFVGVDFGTTFSGRLTKSRIAYAWGKEKNASERIREISIWPGRDNNSFKKIPTKIAYCDSGSAQDVKWSYQLKPTDDCLQCFKLLLDPRQEFPSWVDPEDLKNQLKSLNKTAEDIVADYLRHMLDATKYALERRFGAYMAKNTPLDFILTVPAVWTDAAKEATKRAALAAGMSNNLQLISEPEAAAIWVLNNMIELKPTIGDNFLICDAGGGTVDLITYEIQNTAPLSLREAVAGEGALCGAIFLNLQFEELVKSRVNKRTWNRIRYKAPGIWNEALACFERDIKHQFQPPTEPSGNHNTKYLVALPGIPDDPDAGIKDGWISLSADEITTMFDKVTGQVIDLIKNQISAAQTKKKSPKSVILVGGFGSSLYLYEKLKQALAEPAVDSGRPSVTVHQATDAWTAVGRGAVLRGMSVKDQVISRITPYHYGVCADHDYDKRKHPGITPEKCVATGRLLAVDQMTWFVKKGKAISGAGLQTHAFNLYFDQDDIPEDFSEILYYCREDTAPTSFNDKTVVPLCDLKIKTKGLRFESYGKFKKLTYSLSVKKMSGGLVFGMNIRDNVINSVQTNWRPVSSSSG
ncbi:hypothetical protein K461DRAFT_312251 [Myriangium duriaei CBS 260.36]|uniref:Actin-like ATPase domain-containing protein n=1 Tax=Myriangium duriaei CBS 260.36 TaxID=1168546 RepID=A0A9P4J3W8_9PEZI|nr:hypothetical protein K461DRAFT_312251 [Myriangium duriaei CBS 260.36]